VRVPVGIVSETVEVEIPCPECAEEVQEGVLIRYPGDEKFRPMHAECFEELGVPNDRVDEILAFAMGREGG